MTPQPNEALKIFISYSHHDKNLLDQLVSHLSMLRLDIWHDELISAGREFNPEIEAHLNSASIILLLVSADFHASVYCKRQEVPRAMDLHKEEKARVIPIILRPCDWSNAPFDGLKALPRDGRAVTDWKNTDSAFKDIAEGIRIAVQEIRSGGTPSQPTPDEGSSSEKQSSERRRHEMFIAMKPVNAPSPFMGNRKRVAPDEAYDFQIIWAMNIPPRLGKHSGYAVL